jgi:HK97 family phage major capsid protein
LNTAKTETRAFTEEEIQAIEDIKSQIAKIDATIKLLEESAAAENKTEVKPDGEKVDEEQRSLDTSNFLKFVRGEDTRALDVASNGGVIPTTIAKKIIERVKELSPIYSMATVYNVGGDLVFPVYDETTSSISAAYVDDLTELIEGTGKFTTVKLQNFIAGTLSRVSKSLMNRTDFDLLNYIVNKVAAAIAEFLEVELIKGTTNKMSGISSTTNTVTSAVAAKVDVDDLIDVQMAVPEPYQAKAVWIMNKATLKSFRKLKDTTGEYILNKDATSAFGWTLLGKTVYPTESADLVATGKKAVFYGDMSGLVVKLAQDVEVLILNEKYATQHAVGVVGYIEADSKVIENQKIAALIVK